MEDLLLGRDRTLGTGTQNQVFHINGHAAELDL